MSKQTYTAICNANGCTFLRDKQTRKDAERLAANHQQMCHHDTSIVNMAPAK